MPYRRGGFALTPPSLLIFFVSLSLFHLPWRWSPCCCATSTRRCRSSTRRTCSTPWRSPSGADHRRTLPASLELDDSANRDPALPFCLSMIFSESRCTLFPDHALAVGNCGSG